MDSGVECLWKRRLSVATLHKRRTKNCWRSLLLQMASWLRFYLCSWVGVRTIVRSGDRWCCPRRCSTDRSCTGPGSPPGRGILLHSDTRGPLPPVQHTHLGLQETDKSDTQNLAGKLSLKCLHVHFYRFVLVLESFNLHMKLYIFSVWPFRSSFPRVGSYEVHCREKHFSFLRCGMCEN